MIGSCPLDGDMPVDQRRSGKATYSTALRIPPGHPCLPGHFPGHPLVPGVLLLEYVAHALRDWREVRLARVVEAKFLAPLHPDEQAQLTLEEAGERIRFTFQRDQHVLARGLLEAAP